MKKYFLMALVGISLVAGTKHVCAMQDRVPNLDFNGEITIGAEIGEDLLRQAFPGADQLARNIFSNVEGTVLMRINGKFVRVTKGGRTVVKILDDPGSSSGKAWEHDEGKGHKEWKEG